MIASDMNDGTFHLIERATKLHGALLQAGNGRQQLLRELESTAVVTGQQLSCRREHHNERRVWENAVDFAEFGADLLGQFGTEAAQRTTAAHRGEDGGRTQGQEANTLKPDEGQGATGTTRV